MTTLLRNSPVVSMNAAPGVRVTKPMELRERYVNPIL